MSRPIVLPNPPLHILAKRELFAAMAMQGLLSQGDDLCPTTDLIMKSLGIEEYTYRFPEHWDRYLAKRAVQQADALLAALEAK